MLITRNAKETVRRMSHQLGLSRHVIATNPNDGGLAMKPRPNPFVTHFNLVKPLVDFGNFSQEGIDPTFITLESGGMLQTTALEIAGDKFAGIYMVRNPDKLRHLESNSIH
jgi:hypothetical protein